MTDTRVWRYCWEEAEEEENGPKGKIVARLFSSEDEVPEDDCWGKNVAHAKVLAGLDFDPDVDGTLPEGVEPRRKRGRPKGSGKKEEPEDNGE